MMKREHFLSALFFSTLSFCEKFSHFRFFLKRKRPSFFRSFSSLRCYIFRNVATGPASDGVRCSRVVEQEGRRRHGDDVIFCGGVVGHVVKFDCVSSGFLFLGSPRRVPSSGCDAACVVDSADCSSSQEQQDGSNRRSSASSETDSFLLPRGRNCRRRQRRRSSFGQ